MEASQRRGGGGGGGAMVPISPSQTPRSSDKVGKDLRSGEGSISGKHDKDKGVNVQVIVRCRPLSEDEVRLHTPVVFLAMRIGKKSVLFRILLISRLIGLSSLTRSFGTRRMSKFTDDKSKKPIALMEDGKEVYAAREKNGIYIPRDRYLQDEAEKKAMSEKIERMELDLDSRDKRLAEVQELYNSQQQLTVELSDKLEKTEKKLQETEHALLDLEERHRQANATIKEKEYLISNLLSLRKHSLSGRLSYEKSWRMLHQMSLICSPRLQLEILHRAVASSTKQQEQQLKAMEEDMHSFVSTKTEATEELRGHLEKLKTMYGSGIKAQDDLAGELDSNSHSTFGRLNCEVSKHSSALEELFGGITSEADTLLHDLQESLHSQEEKLSAYAQQQREAHSRAVESTRSISQITVNFFKTLDGHASKLGEIVEEAQAINDQKLSELEKKFEECAANEEKQLLAKVAELLAGSNARKKKLVKCAIDGLRESAATRTDKLQQEMSIMQDTTCSVKAEWTSYTQNAESHYLEDTAAVENGKSDMEDILSKCLGQAKLGAQQWQNAQASLLHLEKSNVASVDEIVRGGMNTIEVLRERFSSAVSSALEDADTGSNNLLTSIDSSLQLDHEACSNLDSMIVPCCGDLRELNSGHYHKIVEITENAGKCLQEEYMVDEPSCSTPRRRPINPPSIASIEELKTPSFEELLKSFWDARSSKQANGDVKHILEAAVSLRDSRLPLTAIN
ncbi:UNVERIFIED_CONTAM: Kinesin-like protein KIN-5D [Sesamum radiatum]|uniref:Kinesin-like protein KIN-5D n=1 Tax=Sesamum radiatum TaxID=300843 RepID=A0AAW2W6F7_SESRA